MERRIIAAQALGDRGEPRALAPLRDMTADDDPYLAAAAVRALVRYDNPDLRACLLELGRTGPASVRQAVRQAVGTGEQAVRDGDGVQPGA
jgi:HEAT repeat protein